MSRNPITQKNELILSVNGVEYSGFTNASFSRSIENMCGQFSFFTTVKESNNAIIQADIRCQDKIEVYIDNNKMLTGYIEDLNISYNSGEHSISFMGRDKTADLIDSSIIEKIYSIRNFKRLIEVVLKDNGFTDIKVIDNVGNLNLLDYEADKNGFKSQYGQSIMDFLDTYAKKLQVLLVTDEDGNLNIEREGAQVAIGNIVAEIGNENNNVLSANINVSTTERFRYVEVLAQQANNDFGEQLDQSAIAEDSIIRQTRRKILTYNIASEKSTVEKIAKWNLNIRKAKGLRYNCRVQGFYEGRNQGFPWKMNSLVLVSDDLCQVRGQFLIQGVSFEKSLDGTFTELSIVNKGAFTINSSKQDLYNPSGNFAENLIRSAT